MGLNLSKLESAEDGYNAHWEFVFGNEGLIVQYVAYLMAKQDKYV